MGTLEKISGDTESHNLRAAFGKFHDWFTEEGNETVINIYGVIDTTKGLDSIKLLSEQINNDCWEGTKGVYRHVAVGGHAASTKRLLVHNLKAFLRHFSAVSWPGQPHLVLDVKFRGKDSFCLPQWKPRPQQTSYDAGGVEFARVVILGKLWDNEFAADFFRGVHAQADELKIRIDDRRTDERTHEFRRGRQLSNLQKVVAENGLEPNSDSILIYFDDVDVLKADLQSLRQSGFWIVPAGSQRGSIVEDSEMVGTLLATCCSLDERSWRERTSYEGASRTVLLLDYQDRNTAQNYARGSSIDLNLVKDELLDVEPLHIRQPNPSDEIETAQAMREIRAAVRRLGGLDQVAAIFPRTRLLTKAVTQWLDRRNAAVRVYGERLLTSDLAILRREDSSLWAVCGIDPYHAGKYALRAACCRWDKPFEKIKPTLVTKAVACEHRLNANSRLPIAFPEAEIKLTSEGYCWAGWMTGQSAPLKKVNRRR